ncbi:hypothetical protein BASA81_000185 [Batrachochytrium salamandrivorans]|nr:hypothetical protein BASA81_000185 [Batrachochytrium salamandrivorans]
MSASDKKMTLMKLLHEHKRPFTLKELEKLGAKAGIVQNSVKDVVKELGDDGLVDTDKIGAARLEATKQETATLMERREEILKDRPQSEERTTKLETLRVLQTTRTQLQQQLKSFEENDPEVGRKILQAAKEAKQACERWTDNTQSVLDWLRKTVSISRRDAEKQMGLAEDFDYPVYVAKKL